MEYLAIEYPMVGETYSHDEYGVYRYSVFPESSVLAGQVRRSFLGSFPTLELARKSYPEAEYSDGTNYREVTVPANPPEWFNPANIGESWNGE